MINVYILPVLLKAEVRIKAADSLVKTIFSENKSLDISCKASSRQMSSLIFSGKKCIYMYIYFFSEKIRLDICPEDALHEMYI